ncbi:hypothetical protein MAY79_27335, partial [Escherichia coli]
MTKKTRFSPEVRQRAVRMVLESQGEYDADRDAWLDSRLESLNWMQVITLVLLDLGKRAKVRQIIEHMWF